MKQVIVTPMEGGEYAPERAKEVFEALLELRGYLDCTVGLVETTDPNPNRDLECPNCFYPLGNFLQENGWPTRFG